MWSYYHSTSNDRVFMHFLHLLSAQIFQADQPGLKLTIAAFYGLISFRWYGLKIIPFGTNGFRVYKPLYYPSLKNNLRTMTGTLKYTNTINREDPFPS